MLLIAQPKSASTSLAYTIARMNNLKCRVGIPKTKNDIRCNGFTEIQRFHDNMIKRSNSFFLQVVKGRKTLFKEHILPTPEHLKSLNNLVRKHRIVILLRNPEDSFDAYRRLFESKNKNFHKEVLKMI